MKQIRKEAMVILSVIIGIILMRFFAPAVCCARFDKMIIDSNEQLSVSYDILSQWDKYQSVSMTIQNNSKGREKRQPHMRLPREGSYPVIAVILFLIGT